MGISSRFPHLRVLLSFFRSMVWVDGTPSLDFVIRLLLSWVGFTFDSITSLAAFILLTDLTVLSLYPFF